MDKKIEAQLNYDIREKTVTFNSFKLLYFTNSEDKKISIVKKYI